MVGSQLAEAGLVGEIGECLFEDSFDEGDVSIVAKFRLKNYAKLMRDKYLVAKPFLWGRLGTLDSSDEPRRLPVVFSSQLERETVRLHIPDGFVPDEFMEPVVIETDFGGVTAKIEREGDVLICSRELRFMDTELPSSRYEEVIEFYEKVARVEQSPVVFVRN